MADAKFGPIFNSHSPDLSSFRARGGKLIQYHGWADPAIPALAWSITGGGAEDDGQHRKFLSSLHGAGHAALRRRAGSQRSFRPACHRGLGRESKAPEMILATKYKNSDASGGVVRTRPLCVFPAKAEWDGKGDKTSAESFRCVERRRCTWSRKQPVSSM